MEFRTIKRRLKVKKFLADIDTSSTKINGIIDLFNSKNAMGFRYRYNFVYVF